MSNENHKIEVRDLRDGDWVWTHKAVLFSAIPDSTFRVYCALGAYAGNTNQRSWPSLTTLAKKLSMSKTTVVKAMQLLEAANLVSTDRRDGMSNLYTLLPVKKTIEVPLSKKADTPFNRLVTFFDQTSKKTRGVKVTRSPKEFAHLKRVLNYQILSEQQIEQLMLYYLASPSFKKFPPTLSVFFSSGIFTGLLNTMMNSETFWKELDRYTEQLKGEPQKRVSIPVKGMRDILTAMEGRYKVIK